MKKGKSISDYLRENSKGEMTLRMVHTIKTVTTPSDLGCMRRSEVINAGWRYFLKA
jgi:hypothetical protein